MYNCSQAVRVSEPNTPPDEVNTIPTPGRLGAPAQQCSQWKRHFHTTKQFVLSLRDPHVREVVRWIFWSTLMLSLGKPSSSPKSASCSDWTPSLSLSTPSLAGLWIACTWTEKHCVRITRDSCTRHATLMQHSKVTRGCSPAMSHIEICHTMSRRMFQMPHLETTKNSLDRVPK